MSEKIKRRDDVDAQAGEEKYGDGEFADPTNHKYPIDTPAHVRAAWSYIHHAGNAAKYETDEVESIKERIQRAAKKLDVELHEQ